MRTGRAGAGSGDRHESGASMVEAVIGLCIAAVLAAFAGPVTAGAIDEGRARHAAAFLAARVWNAREQAAARGNR
jgi:Tfp pilus assembly protein FimT